MSRVYVVVETVGNAHEIDGFVFHSAWTSYEAAEHEKAAHLAGKVAAHSEFEIASVELDPTEEAA